MCQISKSVDVHTIKEHLLSIVEMLPDCDEPVNATLVKDEHYLSMTAVIGNQVLCINLMN